MDIAQYFKNWSSPLQNVDPSQYCRPYIILESDEGYVGVYVENGSLKTLRHKNRRILKKLCKRSDGLFYPVNITHSEDTTPHPINVTFRVAFH